jgi:hypothetical protein
VRAAASSSEVDSALGLALIELVELDGIATDHRRVDAAS